MAVANEVYYQVGQLRRAKLRAWLEREEHDWTLDREALHAAVSGDAESSPREVAVKEGEDGDG